MKRFIIILILFITLGAAGCTTLPAFPEDVSCRVVTEVLIQVENVPEPGVCRYADPAKMIKALNCLRRLDPWELPDTDPAREPGPRYRISLGFSDGSVKYYELVGNSYLREDWGPWQVVSAQHALRFPLLLAAVPSDAI